MIIALLDPEREFVRLCQTLDEPELATSPLFATHEARKENAAELHAILLSQFESKPLSHWREKFRDLRYQVVTAAYARRSGSRSADARLRRDHKFRISRHGVIETVSSPIFVADSEKQKPRTPPDYGAHTREVLEEVGYSAAEIERLIKSGAAAAKE